MCVGEGPQVTNEAGLVSGPLSVVSCMNEHAGAVERDAERGIDHPGIPAERPIVTNEAKFYDDVIGRKYQKLLTLRRALEAMWELTRYERSQNSWMFVVRC